MSKQVKIILIVVVIAIVGYFIYKKYQANKRQQIINGVDPAGTEPVADTGTGQAGYSDSFPLAKGSRGQNVAALQYAINEGCGALGAKIGQDGVFGPQTESAVDICLSGRNGHQKGKVSYAEYEWLRKQVTSQNAELIRRGCMGTPTQRAAMLSQYGIDCAARGY